MSKHLTSFDNPLIRAQKPKAPTFNNITKEYWHPVKMKKDEYKIITIINMHLIKNIHK